jgi:hypothetical protein
MRLHHRTHPHKATQPGAPRQPHQQGLGLIAHRVPGSDAVASGLLRRPQQEFVPNLPRDLLDAPSGFFRHLADVRFSHRRFQPQSLCQGTNEPGIFSRFLPPKHMVEMRDVKSDSGSQSHEDVQQSYGIRSAGHRDQHALSAFEQS